MSNELLILIIAAVSIGFFHTLFGPDHYLPFIVMSRSGRWSIGKTTLVTVLCGIGHVLSSILLGILGITLGIAISKVEGVESFRGGIATWSLIAFSLIYFVWGVQNAIKNKPHKHLHAHKEGDTHIHTHSHIREHMHVHEEAKSITPWVLFIIFIFGPCEPLIPMLMYPAAKNSLTGLILVATIFSVITILTMVGIVLISTLGINLIPLKQLERYTHAIAGAIIFFCGISVLFFGL